MASVIHLEEGEHPPDIRSCVVVLRDTAGGYFVLSSADSYQREDAPTGYPIVESERSAAIERAKTFAEKHGVETVYVGAD